MNPIANPNHRPSDPRRSLAEILAPYGFFATILILAAALGTGCVSTGSSSADSAAIVSAPRTVADYAAEAHDVAYLAASVYLATRDRIDPDKREAVRQAYGAFDQICDAYLASRGDGGELLAVEITDAILDRVDHDPATRPLIRALVQRIVSRLDRAGVPLSALDAPDLWRVVLGVRNGIRAALDDAGVDPSVPIITSSEPVSHRESRGRPPVSDTAAPSEPVELARRLPPVAIDMGLPD